jgi:hypothetical protein
MRFTIIIVVVTALIAVTVAGPGGASVTASNTGHEPAGVQTTFQDGDGDQAEEPEDRPWVPILVISLLIPAAALAVPTFFGKGGSGGH